MSRRYEQLVPHDDSMEELAAAFALGAIEPGERGQFETHLAGCARCSALVRDYGAVVTLLPSSVDQMDVSLDVRERLMADVATEPRVPAVEPRVAPTEPTPIDRARTRRFSLSGLAVAALVVVSLSFGYWNYRLQSELRDVQQAARLDQEFVAALAAGAPRYTLSGTAEAPSAHGAVVIDPAGGQPFLLVGDLPSLPPDRTYQAWVVGAAGPVDAGVFPSGSGGSHLTRLNQAPRAGETVALTVEPAGGVAAPTGQIVLAGAI
jgi:anti-sigma-K factor RskA